MSVRYFTTPELSPGRMAFALGLTHKRLPAQTPPAVADRFAAAQAAAQRWFDLGEAYTQARKGKGRRGDAQVIDRAVDTLLARVVRICTALAELGADHPEGAAAAAFLARFFPDGVRAVIHVEFERQLILMEAMLPAFEQAPAADWIAALPIGGLLTEVKALVPDYRAELERLGIAVTAADVRDARLAARALFEQAIAGARFAFPDDAVFDAALAPISTLVTQFRKARKASTPDTDVDPQTGVELPEALSDADDDA